MASLGGIICRSGLSLTRRPLLLSSVRNANKMMADPMEHATGLERKELEALVRGNDDPFNTKALKAGPGTRDQPTIVQSFHDARIVGCVCHEDSFYISYMWLYKGEPQRCECGHWYKLTEAKDPFAFLKEK